MWKVKDSKFRNLVGIPVGRDQMQNIQALVEGYKISYFPAFHENQL